MLDIATADLALEIPRFNTPYNGDATDTTWPLVGVSGCGNTGNPPPSLLEECTKPINPDAPSDMEGWWKSIETGQAEERIKMWGNRWIGISLPVIHNFLSCSGVLNNGLGC